MQEPVALVQNGDVHDLRVEDLLDLVAHDVVDRQQLELAGERLLDAVDQAELSIALAGLVDEARVVECDAEAPGKRAEELHVGVAERVLPVEILERDRSAAAAAGGERHPQRRS